MTASASTLGPSTLGPSTLGPSTLGPSTLGSGRRLSAEAGFAPSFGHSTASRRRPRHLVPPRLIAVLAATAALWITMTTVQADQPVVVEHYVVASGDSLWTIAGGITPDGADVREVLTTIRELNQLASSTIHPGQTLVLPVGR